jgi:Ribbon-helix-helix protein, copG family
MARNSRIRKFKRQVNVKLEDREIEMLDDEAEKRGTNRSAVVRLALDHWKKTGQKPDNDRP